MRKFLLRLQFNGRAYSGFQRQPGRKTVQGQIEQAIYDLFDVQAVTDGCSRTDTGVSAREFYLTFAVDTKLPADRVAYKLNRYLPKDIQVQCSCEVALDYKVREHVIDKTYVYSLYSSPHVKPLFTYDTAWVKDKLDIQAMNTAARYFEGKHDFTSVSSTSPEQSSAIKNIKSCVVEQLGDAILIKVTADGFAYNMVRIIVGTLVEVGKGTIPADSIAEILAARDRNKAGATMPAKALTLYRVTLKED